MHCEPFAASPWVTGGGSLIAVDVLDVSGVVVLLRAEDNAALDEGPHATLVDIVEGTHPGIAAVVAIPGRRTRAPSYVWVILQGIDQLTGRHKGERGKCRLQSQGAQRP